MRAFMNAVRAEAQKVAQSQQTTRLGLISGYDPDTYCVKVQFPPDESETGWIPLGALAVGPGWGIYAGPVIGDQVQVNFQDGDRDAGIACIRLFDNESPPASVPSGEIWVLHKMGAFFKLTNDGKAAFNDGQGGSVTLNGDGTLTSTGTWTHQGSMVVQQNLTVQQNVEVDGNTTVKAITSNGTDISSTHFHGNGNGGAPTTPPIG
jgi:phage baseplate assembly protein V